MREQVVRDIKEEFLGTSFIYLVKHGLENTSVRDLCKAIGISTGSLYYWFDNKDDLYINSAKYGLEKVASSIFEYAFRELHDLKNFFDNVLDEIIKYKPELHLIYQVATSPVYGPRMREKADDLDIVYHKLIKHLAEILGCSPEPITPIVFMFISIILDYVIWEDYETTKMQLNYLYTIMSREVEASKN